MENNFTVILVACASRVEAEAILRSLLDKRLVACGNIIGRVRSIFRWKDKIESASEELMLLKARRKDFLKIDKEIRRLHSYEVPEIIALPVSAGSARYLKWVENCTCKK